MASYTSFGIHLRRAMGVVALLALSLGSGLPAAAETREVVAGPEYGKSGFYKLWFGEGYRKLWTTPFEVEVLDLQKEAGGLSIVRRVGGYQTPGLALKGAEGGAYTFRSINKDAGRLLPDEWQGSVPEGIMQDQTANSHPGVTPVLQGLSEAVGWLPFAPQRLVVMPDDPALAEHRKDFAGRLGTFGEFPMPAGDGQPGFMGATEIISSRKLWDRWREGPENRIDSRAFLRQRIVSLWVGNWDRHQAQYRWARVPGKQGFQAIAEDPDQAFADYGGLVLKGARLVHPKLLAFGDKISGMEGAVANGADLDRWLLADLGREVFVETGREIQALLTDAAIDAGVRKLPPAWYAINGEALASRLEKRRDDLVGAAERFYRHLAAEVNIHGTDRDEVARIRRIEDGSVEISVGLGDGEPYYRRRFEPKDTNEVRLYLHAGNDRVESVGPAKGSIKVRVLGGPGNDSLDESRSGKTQFIDFEGSNRVEKGKGTSFDERPWENPAPWPGVPWIEPRDYRSFTAPMPHIWWDPNLGVFVGAGGTRTAWGFRKYPYATVHSFSAGYATRRKSGHVEYYGSFRRMNSGLFTEVRARVSGIDTLNFFGFGNETLEDEALEFFEVEQNLISFRPTFNWETAQRFAVHFGPEVQYTEEKSSGTFIEGVQPYGAGQFGQVGVVLGLEWDTRGLQRILGSGGPTVGGAAAQKGGRRYTGLRLEAEGDFFPKTWDAVDSFSSVEGSLSAYLGFGEAENVVLAARAGGRKVWGTYPWHEAAFIGGSGSNRGFREQRFAGDSAAYGNAELRIHLFDGLLLIPGRVWLFGLADVGRVWLDGEDSDEWHPSFGGGLVLEVMGTPTKFWIGAAKSKDEESARIYFKAGFGF